MPVASCPNCGKPAAVSLATPDAMRCDACGYRGSPSPDIVQSLREAAHVVARSPFATRQLSDSVRRALGSRDTYRTRFTLIFIVCCAPIVLAALLFGIGHLTSNDDVNWVMIVFVVAMVGETVALGAVGRHLVAQRQRAMEDACAARPPQIPGAPMTCHVCGADLTGHVEAFVRCNFCAADNLVHPTVLGRARGALLPWFGSQAAAVESAFARMRDANRGATVVMILGALGVPPFVVLQFAVGLAIVNATGPDFDGTVRYTVAKTAAGNCVGRIQRRHGDTTLVIFGAWRPNDIPEDMSVPNAQVHPFTLTKLRNKHVRSYIGETGTVTGFFASPLTGNSVRLHLAAGHTTSSPATGLCLAAGEKAP